MITRNVILAGLLIAAPANAQKLGAGGTIVDGNQVLEKCAAPIGTVSLSEERKAAVSRRAFRLTWPPSWHWHVSNKV